jgi:hypothetical protein
MFSNEDEGSMFLRDVGPQPKYYTDETAQKIFIYTRIIVEI